MKFSAKQDIEAPAEYVFAALSDFDAWERAAMRRGSDVERTDKLRTPGAGMAWKTSFLFRGKARQVNIRLLSMVAPSRLEFAALSNAIDTTLVVEVIEMSARRARLHVTANVAPLTLTAKLFIQSLRLARARVDRKFALRVTQVTGDIEARYRSEQAIS
jgi:hypothetical protein